jgi:membrane protease YdiL (CAAX protease family)
MAEVSVLSGSSRRLWRWVAFVVAALVALEAFDQVVYGIVVPLTAAVVFIVDGQPPRSDGREGVPAVGADRRDLWVVGGVYSVAVGLFICAFRVFGTDRTLGLFLCFAAGLLVGVVVPVVYTVWRRARPLRSLGLGLHELPRTMLLGLLFASVQFGLTLWGYDLPDAENWVPLMTMALVVGMFESVFFRGFVQGRLSAMWGRGVGVGGAATLYALYHVGYGMGAGEMVFLLGLGVVYAIAFQLTSNVLVLWPLLTPLGSFYANLDSGDVDLPWASIVGFVEVAAVMVAVVALAYRHERRSLDNRSAGVSARPRRRRRSELGVPVSNGRAALVPGSLPRVIRAWCGGNGGWRARSRHTLR